MADHFSCSTALLLIDVQQGLDDPRLGRRNNPQAETNMIELLRAWRAHEMPLVFIRHCSTEPYSPLRPKQPGNAYKPGIAPCAGEVEFTKSVNSAFVGTGLEAWLRANDVGRLVIAGLTTDHCVSATTRSASDLGFEVTLLADATATFERIGYDGRHYSADEIHRVNLASLDREFCRVETTAEVLAAIGTADRRA